MVKGAPMRLSRTGMPRLMILPHNGNRVMRQELNNANYNSIAEFVEAMNLAPRNAQSTSLWDAWRATEDKASFYGAGCRTGKDVQDKMRDGWKEGRDRLNDLRAKINTVNLVPQDRKRRKVKTDFGDVLDIHQVYAGKLETAWTVARRQVTRGPQRIDIVANMICSGHESSDVLFWRGAAAAVLADLLTNAGYMVRLTVIFGGVMNGEKVSCRIVVKDHDRYFDVTSVSSVILPGFFRALGHSWIASHCKQPMSPSGISVGQGKVEPHEILLSHTVRDHGSALAFVNDTIAKINDGSLARVAC
jgi:hypothetical protein